MSAQRAVGITLVGSLLLPQPEGDFRISGKQVCFENSARLCLASILSFAQHSGVCASNDGTRLFSGVSVLDPAARRRRLEFLKALITSVSLVWKLRSEASETQPFVSRKLSSLLLTQKLHVPQQHDSGTWKQASRMTTMTPTAWILLRDRAHTATKYFHLIDASLGTLITRLEARVVSAVNRILHGEGGLEHPISPEQWSRVLSRDQALEAVIEKVCGSHGCAN